LLAQEEVSKKKGTPTSGPGAAGAGCGVCFLFGYFLFAPGGDPQTKRK